MRFRCRFLLLLLLSLLLLSTVVLWTKYATVHRRFLALKEFAERDPIIPEIQREFVKRFNHSSSVVYQPHLPNSRTYRLIVVSLSAGAYYKRRSAVRETWIRRLRSWNENRGDVIPILHYFISFTPKKEAVRSDLMKEAEHYQDLVIFSDRDKYSQLTAQTLTALDWIDSQFDFDFVLKTDDDSLVHVDEIMDQLEGKSRTMFGGKVYKHRHPGNEKEKSWVELYHPGEESEFREFAPGAGYILGRDLLQLVLSHSNSVQLIAAEDVYMGEVVGQLGFSVTPLDFIYPIWQQFCTDAEAGTRQLPWTIIHWLDPSRMVRFWERINSGLVGCHKQDMSRARQQQKSGAFSRN